MAITLKAARVNKNMTQKEASKYLKISEDKLSRYERGLQFPTVPEIQKMEELYGVSYNEIIFLPEKNG